MNNRFECPSVSLSLSGLLRKARHILWLGLGLAVAMHAVLSQLGSFREEEKTARPLTTQFVKRQPRLTKPLELKKRPQPKRRQIQREMVSVKAKMERDRGDIRFQPTQVLRGLARPRAEIGRITAFGRAEIEPRSLAGIIEGTREVEQKIDMSLELLDIDMLNTGKHHAMVIQDPEDKRNIRGFFRLARVKSVNMFYTSYDRQFQVQIRIRRGVRKLMEAMNEYTQIKVDLISDITFDDAELLKVPWIYSHAAGNLFQITDSEAENLARYMLTGGFFFSDGWVIHSALDQSYHAAIEKTLATKGLRKGRDWDFEVLPIDHPIFHCYYDIQGLPTGSEGHLAQRINPEYAPSTLKGIVRNGRLVAIHCNKAYVFTWGDWATPGMSSSIVKRDDLDNRRQLQFGINTVIFALTQEGSITRRLMDAVR